MCIYTYMLYVHLFCTCVYVRERESLVRGIMPTAILYFVDLMFNNSN